MLKFHKYAGNIEQYHVILSNKRHQYFGEILVPESLTIKCNFNAADEISFSVHKINEYLWDNIVDFMYVFVPELGEDGEYFEIQVNIADGQSTIKNVVGSSACEVELGQVMMYDFEVNSENDIERVDYVVTKFYDPNNPKGSLLNRALYKCPNYTIGHVDETLANMQRTFSVDGVSVYDFLTSNVANEFNCVFLFDSVTRTINAYDLLTTCMHQTGTDDKGNPIYCQERGDFFDVCSKCGNHDNSEFYYYGNDTTIYIDSDNLAGSDINLETDKDSVKNCFRLVAGDDDMTAAVRSCNPNGSDYIYYFSDEQKSQMSDELVDRLNEYDILWNSLQDDYKEVMQGLYDAYDKILYYQTSMMPEISSDPDQDIPLDENGNIDEKALTHKQIEYLNIDNLNPIGVDSVTTYTSKNVIEYAITDYSKVYVSSAYYKVDVANSNDWDDYLKDQAIYPDYFTTAEAAEDLNSSWDFNNSTWTGYLKVTNYNDRNNPCFTTRLTINIITGDDNVAEFTRQKIDKLLIKYDDLANSKYQDKDRYMFDVLKLNTSSQLNKFIEAIKMYSLDLLTSFNNAITTCMDTLMEMGLEKFQFNDGDYAYIPYDDYYNMKVACELEMTEREATIRTWEQKRDECLARQEAIQEDLNFDRFLGTELLSEFCAWRREDEYNNSNYIIDNLKTNEEIFARAQEFLNKATKELKKASSMQYRISTTLNNLLAISDYYPVVEEFNLGDWIRVKVDDKIFRLRLISYQLDFDSIEQLDVEFSEATNSSVSNPYMDLRETLEQAKSMATSYAALTTQVNKGAESAKIVNRWLDSGFDLTQSIIVNDADSQGITIDNHGILARRYNEFSDTFDPEQIKIFNNGMYLTDDNWKTIKTAVGKYYYTNPTTGEVTETYGILADTIVGKFILGNNLQIVSMGIDPATGEATQVNFQVDGNGVTINGGTIRANKTSINDPTSGFYFGTDGQINIGGSNQYIKMLSNGEIVIKSKLLTIGGTDVEEELENTLRDVTIQYAVSDSEVIGPDPDDDTLWTTTPPTVNDGQYLWERSINTTGDGSTKYQPSKNGVCISGRDGKDAISVIIDSSAGNIFRNNNTYTVLTCYVYRGVTDITNSGEIQSFTWKRRNAAGVEDPDWVYVTSSNVKTINNQDVLSKAIIICEPNFK